MKKEPLSGIGFWLFSQLGYHWESFHHMIITTGSVRHKACTAVFHSIGRVGKIAAAFISQSVKRAIAKQAVKVLRIRTGMTWIVRAINIGKI